MELASRPYPVHSRKRRIIFGRASNGRFIYNFRSGHAQSFAGAGFIMRMIGSLPAFRSSRSPALAFAGLLIILWLGYQAAQLVLWGDISNIVISGLLCVGAAVVVAILNDWRRGLYLFLAWLLFEDLFRKYLGNNMAIFFAKDFLVVVVYLSYLISRRGMRTAAFRPPFLVPLLLFFWLGVIQVFNLLSTSIFFGLLGMKIYFLYVPLLFLGYNFIESDQDLRRFLTFNAVLVICVAGLGIAQSIIGPTFLNPQVLQEEIRELASLYRFSPISGLKAYRPTSVFVSTGRFSNFTIVSWVLMLGFGGYLLLRSKRGRQIAFLSIGVVGLASIMSTSRSVFLWTTTSALVMMAGFLWGAPWRQGEVRRVLRAIQRTVMIAGVAILLMITFFPAEIASRFAIYSETLSPYSASSELVTRSRDYPLRNFLLTFDHEHWLTGYGIGTASLGIQYVTRILHATPMRIGVENGYGQIILEMGLAGILLWLALSASIVLAAWQVVKQLRQTPWFPVGFSIFWYAFLLLIPMSYVGFVAYQDYVMNAYLWLMLGILFRLPDIARQTTLAEAQRNTLSEARQG
jgi:hypothetical protein